MQVHQNCVSGGQPVPDKGESCCICATCCYTAVMACDTRAFVSKYLILQNHGMVGVGIDLWRSASPTHLRNLRQIFWQISEFLYSVLLNKELNRLNHSRGRYRRRSSGYPSAGRYFKRNISYEPWASTSYSSPS